MKKILKEILLAIPLAIFFCGTAIAIVGWLMIDMIDKERIKEIKIIKGNK